jgi:predicted ATPase
VSAQQNPPNTSGARVLSTSGVERESPLAFSALHRLLRPVANLDRLPAPQARALRVAFGLEDGPSVEPFLVGVATLSALTDAAERDGPLLCVVDDAHWLDSASANALLFAARRLAADPVAMVFAARTPDGDIGVGAFDPQGLTVLELRGLDDEAARQLLGERSDESLPGDGAAAAAAHADCRSGTGVPGPMPRTR